MHDRSKNEAPVEVHIMPYSHHDFSWRYTRQWHIRTYVQIFSEVLEVMRRKPDFTWYIDNVIHSLTPFIAHSPKEQIEEFKRLVKEGRIYIANGGFSLARPTYVGDETFIRNMVEGKRFFRQFFDIGEQGIDVFNNADVGCGHSQLPQMLRLAGHFCYRFQRPEQALNDKAVPRQFVWKGLDGSRVIVSRGTYNGFGAWPFTTVDYENRWEEVKRWFVENELGDKTDALLAADIVWLNNGFDDSRPLKNYLEHPIPLTEFIEAWNKRENTQIGFSTPGRYFSALAAKQLPVHEGVLDPCELAYNAPFRGNHSMWRLRKELDRLIVKAESLAAMASLTGDDYPYARLEALWERLFAITGHAIEFTYREDFESLYAAATEAKLAVSGMIESICGRMAVKPQLMAGTSYVAFNTLSWERTELVELHITMPEGVSGFDLYDGCGRKADYQMIGVRDDYRGKTSCEYSEVHVLAEVRLPSMGYIGLTAAANGALLADKVKRELGNGANDPRPPSPDRIVIDNGLLELTVEKGWLIRVREQASGRMIEAGAGRPLNVLQFVQTKPMPDWQSSWESVGANRMEPTHWELAETGPLRWVVAVHGTIGSSVYTQKITLQKGVRAIGFEAELDSREEEGYFAVSFGADVQSDMHADIPFGVEERELSRETYGSFERGCAGMFYAKSWVSYRCADVPSAIVSENGSIYYIRNQERNELSLVLNRSLALGTRTKSFMKHTHPSVEGKGKQRYNYSLFLPEHERSFAAIAKFAQAKSQPVESVPQYVANPDDPMPACRSFLHIQNEHMIASSFYREKGSLVLRLYEAEGQGETVRIGADFRIGEAKRVNLLGEEQEDVATPNVSSNQQGLTLEAKPWQIITLHMQTEPAIVTDHHVAKGIQ
jgi:alpha-mannosidase